LARVDEGDPPELIREKFALLVRESRALDFVKEDERVALKLHFGEEANTGYVKPEYVRVAVDELLRKKTRPFLSDTNTLYRGRRMTAPEHQKLAAEHGFTQGACAAQVIIPDDTQKENIREIEVNGKFIKAAKVARLFADADGLVDIAHFKGHIMTGFGGALKNVGMGCASREGKLAQHSDISPFVIEQNCKGCSVCIEACPVDAITLIREKASIDNARCIGCATCIAVCPYMAIEVNWEAGGDKIQEKMVEYASAILLPKKNKCAFFNFLIKITKECDCLAKDDPRIAPDIGILASSDPVSIDKASLDLVTRACGKDVFLEAHPARDGLKQLAYAAKLGLGSMEYELVEV